MLCVLQILKVLCETAVAVRTKALKCLTAVIEADPAILARVSVTVVCPLTIFLCCLRLSVSMQRGCSFLDLTKCLMQVLIMK